MKKTQRSFLAIEFAASGVKLVQMKGSGKRFQLLAARSIPTSSNHRPEDEEALWKEAVRQLLSEENLKNQSLLLSVNSPHTCFSRFVLPRIPEKELTETLKWKMKEEMPFAPEEAVFDHRLFRIVDEGKVPRFSVLVAATPRDSIDRFLKLLPQKGPQSFQPASASFSIAAMPNAFSLSNRDLAVVVDIGRSITEIAVYADGRLSFLRKIAFGGETLSHALIQPLVSAEGHVSLDLEEAERAKEKEHLLNADNQSLVAGKIEVSKLYALIRPELEKLASEIGRSLDYYAEQHGSGAARIFLTGGSGRLKGLDEFLAGKFEIPVKRIEFAQDIKIAEALQKENLDPFYRLISLILDRKDIGVSFFSALQKSVEYTLGAFSYVYGAVIVCLLFLAFGSGMFWRYHQTARNTEVIRAELRRLKSAFDESQKVQEIETEVKRGKVLVSALLAKEPYWGEVFRELAHHFPERVVLTEVTYERNVFILKGTMPAGEREGAAPEWLLSFLSLDGPVFQKATLINTERSGDLVTFTIRCEVL